MVKILENYEQYKWIIDIVWTAILLPLFTYAWSQFSEYAKSKKMDKYVDLLKDGIENAVKDVQSTYVEKKKNTENWDEAAKAEALQLAKDKAIFALSDSAYKALKLANEDFDAYLETLIEAKLYDLKK